MGERTDCTESAAGSGRLVGGMEGAGRARGRTDHAAGTDGPLLALCGHTARRSDLRRGLCRVCYRKLAEHDCLPPRGSRWDSYDALAVWARGLPAETRARILAALAEAS